MLLEDLLHCVTFRSFIVKSYRYLVNIVKQ